MRANGVRSRLSRGALISGLLLALSAAPAGAVHFFTNCAQNLQTPASTPGATVNVQGFSFTDQDTGGPVSQVTVGQTINFTWGEQFCHSVTVVPMGLVTPNLMESNPNLSRPSGLNDTKPLSFDEPGVFLYYCEHHWPAGMVGVVFVTAP